MYDRTHNLISTDPLARRSANINKHGRKRMSNKTVLEKMKTKVKIYKYNDELNSKNTIGFKDGAER